MILGKPLTQPSHDFKLAIVFKLNQSINLIYYLITFIMHFKFMEK